MKRIGLVLLGIMVLAAFGCWPPPPAPPPAPGPSPTPAPKILAQGSKTAAHGVATTLATVGVNKPGTLHVRISWTGLPKKMVAYVKHGGPANHGWKQSVSPLVSTVHVPGPTSGWTLYVSNSGPVDRVVKYIITFTPD